ncbi:HEAT repeat-containing protein 6 isoform X1 [Anastrepha obliqua]|uniref:HEAT repeat-containing protein 6 isoform X1 n=2 Tax=Anastrepha obliqua TaxID=95512 RepID=UPI002409DB70|nr:HEAT repeat-containing protein 6 isoform X1 [Anastrepha obliqua]
MVTLKAVLEFMISMHNLSNFKACKVPQIILYSLILIKKLLSLCHDDINLFITDLLEISLGYMFFENPIGAGRQTRPLKIKFSQQYSQNTPDDLAADEPKAYKIGGKSAKQKRCRLTRTRGIVNALESAFKNEKSLEDNSMLISKNYFDVNQYDVHQTDISAKIRITSISLFGDVTRSMERRYLYSYWQSIFPCDIADSINGRNDILVVCQTDENMQCRCAALHVCTDLFLNSRDLFNQAEFKVTTTAFVPFSQMLGLTIMLAYKTLITIIEKESSIPVIMQALKCSAALVQVTPFVKFECDLVYNFVNTAKKLASHTDFRIQISALTVLEYLLMEPEISIGLLEALGIPKGRLKTSKKYRKNINNETVMKDFGVESVYNTREIQENEGTSIEPFWLISKVFSNLGINRSQHGARCRKIKTCNPLRIKCLNLLSAMATHFELFLRHQLEELAIALEDALNEDQFEFRLTGSKCLDACVYQMSEFLKNTVKVENIETCKHFWTRMVPVIMHKISKEKESTIKIVLCESLSNIGMLVFENLTQSIRLTLLSFLTSVSSDPVEDEIIRATVVRALSVFVTFPSMRIDLVFIENTAELILRLAKSRNIAVRIKIFWAMGNVTDALVENNMEISNEPISDEILWSLIRNSTYACIDNDKVRCNAVRSLGNLLRLLSEKHFCNLSDRTVINCSINKLIESIRSSGSSKVKWNSCYAVGNMLQNENIFLSTYTYKDLNWQSSLYSTLCHIIQSHTNYKVKINATTAIIHITKRKYFGEHYGIIWSTIIRAIEQSYNLQNFYEYNHRDQFQEKLCVVMCHIINLATFDDFPLLSRMLLQRAEVVKQTWIKVTTRMIPGKATPLLSSCSHLDELLRNRSILNLEQINAIKFVRDCIPFCY